jgi:large subunit ribosomal protein L7/L12
MAEKDKVKKLIEEIEKLSVLELNQLVKALEEKFGVQAQAVAPAPSAAAPGAEEEAKKEEKAVVNLVLSNAGDKKINVIKAVREIKPDIGLKEAKDLVEKAPQVLLKDVERKQAEEAKKKLEAAGAQVELK